MGRGLTRMHADKNLCESAKSAYADCPADGGRLCSVVAAISIAEITFVGKGVKRLLASIARLEKK